MAVLDLMDIVRLDEMQIGAAGAALARGFHYDPLAVYMIPDSEQRARSLPAHFSAFVRLGHLFGEVYTTRGTPQGAAVWFGPGAGAWELQPEQLEVAGVARLEQELPTGAFARFVSVLQHLEPLHKRDAPTQHWYLAVLGVDRELQGRGISSALLQPILRRADEHRLPCYLETVEPSNVPFYRKHGFEVVVEGVEPKSGLRFWTFLRAAHLVECS